MTTDQELHQLLAQADRHAAELEGMLASMQEYLELPVAFSRSGLVEELGFDASAVTLAPAFLHAVRG